MLHSRDIDALRADVAENCRALLARAAERGLPVLVTETVRDEAYQRYLVSQGYAAKGALVPSFHSVAAGLAFDVCKNVHGHEYDDAAFFEQVGQLGKELGFTWGGDWERFPDRPHFQWDDGGRYSAAMVRAGHYPPPMPCRSEKEEEEKRMMTQEEFNVLADGYLRTLAEKEPSAWSAEARAWAEEQGLLRGDGVGAMQYCSFVTREQMAVILQRLARLCDLSDGTQMR